MSMRPGRPKLGSAKGKSERCFYLRSNGTGDKGRSHVTLGTTTAVTVIDQQSLIRGRSDSIEGGEGSVLVFQTRMRQMMRCLVEP